MLLQTWNGKDKNYRRQTYNDKSMIYSKRGDSTQKAVYAVTLYEPRKIIPETAR